MNDLRNGFIAVSTDELDRIEGGKEASAGNWTPYTDGTAQSWRDLVRYLTNLQYDLGHPR